MFMGTVQTLTIPGLTCISYNLSATVSFCILVKLFSQSEVYFIMFADMLLLNEHPAPATDQGLFSSWYFHCGKMFIFVILQDFSSFFFSFFVL